MIKPVTLLVCLSPSVPQEKINELSFFNIVNVFVEVKNVRIVTLEGQMKAFVQVADRTSADFVIGKLHGRLMNIGKVKVFESNKRCVIFPRSLAEIFSLCEAQDSEFNFTEKDKIRGTLQNTDTEINLLHFQFDFGNGDAKAFKAPKNSIPIDLLFNNTLEKLDQKIQGLTDSKLEPEAREAEGKIQEFVTDEGVYEVMITHNDVALLREKKILRIFRRFGRITNYIFEHSTATWILRYRFEREIDNAANKIDENKLYGYKLIGMKKHDFGNACVSQPLLDGPKVQSESEYSCSNDNHIKEGLLHPSLQFYLIDNDITIRELCKLIVKIHTPVQIAQCYNVRLKKPVFIAYFMYISEAAEVLVAFNALRSRVRCNLVSIDILVLKYQLDHEFV